MSRPSALGPLLLLAAIAAGCARPQAEPTSSTPAQVLRFGNGTEPADLDPQTVTGIPEHHIVGALFEGLAEEDPKDLHPVPGLATSWEVSADGLVYTFHLRDNIRWSDGLPITTDDFIQSWKRLISPKLASQYAYLVFNYVKGAKDYYDGKVDFSKVGFAAPDSKTLVITLAGRTPFLIKLIASHGVWDPVPIHVLEKFGALEAKATDWTKPGNIVTSGAFKLKEWTPQKRLVVVRNPYYWDAQTVKLDEIDFFPIDDGAVEERMFRTGQLDLTSDVPVSKIDVYRKEHPEFLHIDPYLGLYFYRCNVARPPLNDKRVRRALALAIDRESLIRDVARGGEEPALSVSPPNDAGYTPTARIKGDLAEARRLLAEAGYPGGAGLPPIELLYNTNENNREIAEAIQAMWRRNLGVDLEIHNEEWKVYLDSQHTLNFQLARAGWIADYVDPSVFLQVWETNNGNNETNWSNPEYDRILHQALEAPNDTVRFALYQKLDAIADDECPILPIYYYTRIYLMSPRVKGRWPTVLDNHPYKYIYLAD